jgi:hypothetical protein
MEQVNTPELGEELLPTGSRIGPFRVVSCAGRGSYGTVYRVERVEPADPRPFALKLARDPKEPRFDREVELLRRIEHAHVPRVHEVGWWKHGSGVLLPYLVMDWVPGRQLYLWAEGKRLSSRQVLRVLGQVARALEATHAAGGVHRDVKGPNVLVNAEDGAAVLVDFGAGTFRGAAPLTWQAWGPGTLPYRSPEALRFHGRWRPDGRGPYEAGPADDVYALGVMAYRLVTGAYPEPYGQVVMGAEEGAEGDERPPWVPAEERVTVSPELARLIRQLLSVEPERRGSARQVAEAAERAARRAGKRADRPITARVARAVPGYVRWSKALWPWLVRSAGLGAAAVAGMVLTLWMGPRVEEKGRTEAAQAGAEDGSAVGLAEAKEVGQVSEPRPSVARKVVGLEMPKQPLPGQLRAPCTAAYEDEVHGGCWVPLAKKKPPCGNDSYEWKGACYLASYPAVRPDTSAKP